MSFTERINILKNDLNLVNLKCNEKMLALGTILKEGMQYNRIQSMQTDAKLKKIKIHLLRRQASLMSLFEEQMICLRTIPVQFDHKIQVLREEVCLEFEKRITYLEKSLAEFTCAICLVNKRNAVLIPCEHGQFCSDCINIIFRKETPLCPICRTVVDAFIIIKN
tara:strand:- start:210 stop:704 length:495 start_codon:yes stop_codon:yes gene_type:complete